MTHAMFTDVLKHGDKVNAALDVLYNFRYDSEVEELRNLYFKGLDLQWISRDALPWSKSIDQEAFTQTFTLFGQPVQETRFWNKLPAETRWEIARRGAALMLSNFLHGEQGALMVASQLVNAVPHMDAKFYAATQTMDEARHVEVFAGYIDRLDHVYPIVPSLKELLDKILTAEGWMFKAVGMQIVIEGLALYNFREMREITREPLLKELLTYVARDEARHTAFGIRYLGRVVPTLSPEQRTELEDFAFEASRMLLDSRRGATVYNELMQIVQQAGVDPDDLWRGLREDEDKMLRAMNQRGGRFGPVSGFVVPTLRRIGLWSERIDGHLRQMFNELGMLLPSPDGGAAINPMDKRFEVPDDLEAWATGREDRS